MAAQSMINSILVAIQQAIWMLCGIYLNIMAALLYLALSQYYLNETINN